MPKVHTVTADDFKDHAISSNLAFGPSSYRFTKFMNVKLFLDGHQEYTVGLRDGTPETFQNLEAAIARYNDL